MAKKYKRSHFLVILIPVFLLFLVIVGGWAGTSFAGPLQRAHLAVIAGSTVAPSSCSGWYGEGTIDPEPSADNLAGGDIRCSSYTTECSGTPTGIRAYNRYSSLPDDALVCAAYGDSGGSGPDTSNLLFYSEEGDDSDGSPDWSGTLSITGASNINLGTKIWLCVWDEVGVTAYYNDGTEAQYYLNNQSGIYPSWPNSGTFTSGSDRKYVIQITYD